MMSHPAIINMLWLIFFYLEEEFGVEGGARDIIEGYFELGWAKGCVGLTGLEVSSWCAVDQRRSVMEGWDRGTFWKLYLCFTRHRLQSGIRDGRLNPYSFMWVPGNSILSSSVLCWVTETEEIIVATQTQIRESLYFDISGCHGVRICWRQELDVGWEYLKYVKGRKLCFSESWGLW